MSALRIAATKNRLSEIISNDQIVTDTRSGGSQISVCVVQGNAEMCRPDELATSTGYYISGYELDFIKI